MSQGGGGYDPLHGAARQTLFYAKRALVILVHAFFL